MRGEVTLQPMQGRQTSFAMVPQGLSVMSKWNAFRGNKGHIIYPGIAEGQATQTVITHNAAYQADDVECIMTLICDERNTGQKLLSSGEFILLWSDALAEVHNLDNVDNNMINQAMQVMPSSE
ncbi:hypothetical protein Tco_1033801 [Tanacetum coccineum]